MQSVKLKNGSTELGSLVAITMNSLRELYDRHYSTLWELLQVCRDGRHKILHPDHHQILLELRLVDAVQVDGHAKVHGSIRAIVLSAVSGEQFAMVIRTPIADDQPAQRATG